MKSEEWITGRELREEMGWYPFELLERVRTAVRFTADEAEIGNRPKWIPEIYSKPYRGGADNLLGGLPVEIEHKGQKVFRVDLQVWSPTGKRINQRDFLFVDKAEAERLGGYSIDECLFRRSEAEAFFETSLGGTVPVDDIRFDKAGKSILAYLEALRNGYREGKNVSGPVKDALRSRYGWASNAKERTIVDWINHGRSLVHVAKRLRTTNHPQNPGKRKK